MQTAQKRSVRLAMNSGSMVPRFQHTGSGLAITHSLMMLDYPPAFTKANAVFTILLRLQAQPLCYLVLRVQPYMSHTPAYLQQTGHNRWS